MGWEIPYLTLHVPTCPCKYTRLIAFESKHITALLGMETHSIIGTEEKVVALRNLANMVGKDTCIGE